MSKRRKFLNCKKKVENQEDAEQSTLNKNYKNNIEILKCADMKRILKMLKSLKKSDINLEISDDNNTLLHLVFKNAQLSAEQKVIILKKLLEKGFDPKIVNENNETALHLAVATRMKEAIVLLIENGSEIHVCDYLGNTIAHFFIIDERDKIQQKSMDRELKLSEGVKFGNDSADFAEWLISIGFDFDLQNNFKQSALDLAIEKNLQHLLPTLLRHSKNEQFVEQYHNKSILYSFLESSYQKDTVDSRYTYEIVKLLLDKGVPTDTESLDGKIALDLAIESSYLASIVELLLERVTDFQRKNKFGQTLFHRVINSDLWYRININNYLKIIRTLIDNGSDINTEDEGGMRPIQIVARDKNLYAAKIMIEYNVELFVITEKNQNLLHLLAGESKYGKVNDVLQNELFDLLVNGVCEVDERDNLGQTPLHVAAATGNILVLQKLIDFGADVNCRANEGNRTALDFATKKKYEFPHMAKLLIDKGAKINCIDSRTGEMPLHKLVASCSNKNVEELLNHGAYVDAWNRNQQTPLALAIQYNLCATIEELLRFGADINDPRKIKMDEPGSSQPKMKKSRYTSSDLLDAIDNHNKSKVIEILEQKNVSLSTIYCSEGKHPVFHLIIRALEEEDVMEIFAKFFEDVDVNLENNYNETALHFAVIRKMKKVIELLINHKANILYYDDDGNYITHYFIDVENQKDRFNKHRYGYILPDDREAAEKEDANYVDWLISKGFSFDHMNHRGVRALDIALRCNDLEHIIPTLLKHTTDIQFINKDKKQNLLHSFLNVAKIRDRNGRSYEFSQRYDIKIVKFLLEKGVAINAVDFDGDTALEIAVREQVNIDILTMLLDSFTDIRKEKCVSTLFGRVVKGTDYYSKTKYEYLMNVVFDLIARGVTIEDEDWFDVMAVGIKCRSLRVINLLKDLLGGNFLETTYDGQNLLHQLAKCIITESNVSEIEAIFDMLIKVGCNINAIDQRTGLTPLHFAASYSRGNSIVVKKLIENGADVNCRGEYCKKTPLHMCMSIESAKLLLDNGADVNSKSFDDQRPIHSVLKCLATKVNFKVYLQRGAYVDVRLPYYSRYGYYKRRLLSALSHCIIYHEFKCVEDLLKYGADINDPLVVQDVFSVENEDFTDMRQYLGRYFVKLIAAGLPISNEWISLRECDIRFRQQIAVELEKLKSTFIDSHTSLYRMLHMELNSRCIHVNNEKLVNLIESESFEKDFPNYYIVIMGSYHQAVTRKKLLTPAKEAWYDLTTIQLPDICVERICAFLSNADLVVMIERYKNEWEMNVNVLH